MSKTANTKSRRVESDDAQEGWEERTPVRLIAEAIYNTRRRYALYYLHKRDGPVELKELVRQVAAWENFCDPEDGPSSKRNSVYSSLHQTHLPYLEECGLVEFDRGANEIECLIENSELSFAADRHTSVRWDRVYLLLAGLGSVAFSTIWIDVPSFEYVPPVLITGVLVCSYLVASVFHWYDVHRWRRRKEGMPPDFTISSDSRTITDAIRNDGSENGE